MEVTRNFKVGTEEYNLLKQASEKTRRSISNFVSWSAVERAKEVLK